MATPVPPNHVDTKCARPSAGCRDRRVALCRCGVWCAPADRVELPRSPESAGWRPQMGRRRRHGAVTTPRRHPDPDSRTKRRTL